MKIITTFCVAILCLNFITVHSHYVYGETMNTGFVSLNNAGNDFPIGFNKQNRRYGNSNSYPRAQTYNVNNHGNTKITKIPPLDSTRDIRNQKPANPIPTEAPKHQRNEEVNYIHDARNYKVQRGKSGQNQNLKPGKKSSNRAMEYGSQTKQYDHNLNKGKGNIYDSKGNIVQVNVHKTQIPAEPQKVKLKSNRQLTALSVQRRDDNYKKMPTSMLVDKTMQSGANFKKRNAKLMARVLDDMTQKVSDRRIKNNDYKKRETGGSYDQSSNGKRNIVSDSIKRYIGADRNVVAQDHQTRDAARIGSREEDIEENNAPYALFYRMSPESLDHQEGFYLMKPMEDDGETVFSNKEKRLSVNYQNEVDLKKPKTKKNYSNVKLRNKVKSLSNF